VGEEWCFQNKGTAVEVECHEIRLKYQGVFDLASPLLLTKDLDSSQKAIEAEKMLR